jgi:hypothetical protein
MGKSRRSDQGQADQRGLLRVGVNPADGTIWGSVPFSGLNHAAVGLTIRRRPLWRNLPGAGPGYGQRNFDIDRNGVAYVPLSSGHMGAFDRRRIKARSTGPAGRRRQALSGRLDANAVPGPQFKNVAESARRASYLQLT